MQILCESCSVVSAQLAHTSNAARTKGIRFMLICTYISSKRTGNRDLTEAVARAIFFGLRQDAKFYSFSDSWTETHLICIVAVSLFRMRAKN